MWRPTKKAKYGVAIYNFDGKVKWGLSLQIGETVQISEECSKWYRGFSMRNKAIKGIFPASHINLKDFQIDVEGPNETVTPVEDPVVKEVSFVLREWSIIWKRLYIERKAPMFTTIRNVMLDLMECRKQLMSGTLTHDQSTDLKAKITNKIDWGNKKLGLDLVPRVDSEQVDVEKISPVELYRIHEESSKSSRDGTVRGSGRPRRSSHRILTHHLYFLFKSFTCGVGEETEIHFSLYDAKTCRNFSEKYVVRLTRTGLPLNYGQGLNCITLFTDLGNHDLLRDAYVVAHIYRMGSLRDDAKKVPTTLYKRPYGCAVLPIKEVLIGNYDAEEDKEFQMKVFTCSENEFPQLHDNIIRKQSSRFSAPTAPSTLGSGIVVSLGMLHGDLAQVHKEQPVLLRGASVARKLGFPDVIMPGDVRNDLYLTLNRGDFERGGKKSPKNVEVRVMVIDEKGAAIESCICPGAGLSEVKEHSSAIFYHCNTPKWNDTIKLTVPIDQFYGSHIRVELRHCSTRDKAEKRLLAFGFVKLVSDDGTTLPDGSHELFLYKCDDANKLKQIDKYTALPSTAAQINPQFGNSQGNVFFNRSERETIFIETLLCSTKLTQNADLLGLLKWRAHPDKIDDNLQRLMNLDGQEIVKYLQDIMDALFNMFFIHQGRRLPQAQLVFRALIYIFKMLGDHRYEHFKPVMDAYIANHFSAVLVYGDLLMCLKEILDAVSTSSDQEGFIDCFMVLDYIAKCIVQSRLLYTRNSGNQNADQFKALVQQVFDMMRQVLSVPIEMITRSQITLLVKIPEVVIELAKVTPAIDLAQNVCLMINSMPREQLAVPLHQVKLQCIRDLLNSPALATTDCKRALLPMVMGQLKRYLSNLQELKLCAEILGDILMGFSVDRQQGIDSKHNIEVLLTRILSVIVNTTHSIMEKSQHPYLGHLVASLVTMWRLMEEEPYRAVLNCYNDKKQLKDFLLNILKLFRELVSRRIYGKDWAVMRMVTNNTILLAVSHFLAETLNKHFLKGMDFDGQLWSSYFRFAVSFLTQPCLQLENFSEAKRQKILDKYGDMRVRMGYEILGMWQSLGDHKLHFVPGMVGPFLEMTLVPETELRKATLPIFFDMMECEQRARGNFKQVESELIDKLDILVSENKGDDEYKQLFNMMLLGKVKSEPSWQENGTAFVGSVTKLLERLLDYRNVLEGEENRDKRMTCTVNLLNFYKNEINRQEMYIRYIYKLQDLHLQCDNHTEAGFTLLLHAELLEWTTQTLHGDVAYPREQEWCRKERLYKQIIEHFDKGQTWEFGIGLCKELAVLYERKIEYAKLSQILQTQACFYNKILNEHRPEPEYFRVGFFGQRFPLFLRNKEFVYRGGGYEKLSSFNQRLLSEFPGATIMGGDPPSDQIKQGDSQCIQIQPVKPLADIDVAFQAQNVPENVRSFYRVNLVDRFQLDRPFHKGQKDQKNIFKTLWIDRTVLQVEHPLPGILRWFEVIQKEILQLSPIQSAIDLIENKNRDLRCQVGQYSTTESSKNMHTFTMELKGVLDPTVNGGISNYEFFLSDEFPVIHPEYARYVPILRSSISEQVHILEGALPLHKKLISVQLTPLHEMLVEQLVIMKKGIETVSPNMTRLVGASKKLMSEQHSDWRSSTNSSMSYSSSKSISPAPTPPGSNRSSGVYCDLTPDTGESEGDSYLETTASTNTLVGFGCIFPLTTTSGYHVSDPPPRSMTWGGNLCALIPSQSRPLDNYATYTKGKKSIEGSGLDNLLGRKGLKTGSSISLDSGLGQGQGQGHHKRSRTSSPFRQTRHADSAPPRLPPRKQQTPGTCNADGGESILTPTKITPPVKQRTPVSKRESLPASLPSQKEVLTSPPPISEEPSLYDATVPAPSITKNSRHGHSGYATPPPVPPKRSISTPNPGRTVIASAADPPRSNYTNVYIPPQGETTDEPAPPVPVRRPSHSGSTPKARPPAPQAE